MSTKVRKYTLKAVPKPQKVYRVRYEDELNSEQLEVVMAGDGPMLVIAGAGSGKTRTLTYRVSRLIEDGVDPADALRRTARLDRAEGKSVPLSVRLLVMGGSRSLVR